MSGGVNRKKVSPEKGVRNHLGVSKTAQPGVLSKPTLTEKEK